MNSELDYEAEYHRQMVPTDSSFQFNLSHEELMKLQLEIIRNFTAMYGSSALNRGHVHGDVMRHPLLRAVVVSIFIGVMVVGVLSNAAVLYQIQQQQQQQQQFSYYYCYCCYYYY